jgi:signal transduction histidine kinase
MRKQLPNLDTKLLKEKFALATQEIDLAKDNVSINIIVEELVSSLMGSEFCSLWFYDEENALLLRERKNSLREISLEAKTGILYECFMLKKAKIYNYLASEKKYVSKVDNPDSIQLKSKIMLPLIVNERLVGIITAYSSVKNIRNFNEDDLELLGVMASYLIDILYKMHPSLESRVEKPHNLREKSRERRTNHLKRLELDTLDKVEEINAHKENLESSDETLLFMANAVHDMRTPANNLYGFLELLEEQVSDPRFKTYLKNAKDSAEYINELSTTILDRISSHREIEAFKKEDVSSAKFFSDISETFISNMHAKNIKFNVFIDPLLPKEIKIEVLKLKRTIINLLGNAYKFTPNDGKIEFAVRYSKDKRIKISVKDSGIGIDKSRQSEIFKAFEQAEESTHSEYGGAGLGLSICNEYIKYLGGELKLDSKLGKGSKFYFDFAAEELSLEASFTSIKNDNIKIAILMSAENSFTANNIAKYFTRMGIDKSKVTAISSASAYPEGITHLISFQNKTDDTIISNAVANNIKTLIVEENLFSLSKKELHNSSEIISQYGYYANILHAFVDTHEIPKVLIVDDDEVSVLLIKVILENEFCEVVVAKDGERALNLLINAQKSDRPFALAFLDNKMPVIYGSEVMKRFRTYEKDNGLKPIYAVSISGDMLKNPQDQLFFDIHVGKPFKKADIKKALQIIC